MVLKKIFKGGKGDRKAAEPDDRETTIEDLIVLERYDEAEERLKARLKVDKDNLHLHLKLADVYTALDRREAATDEYLFVAEEYARDGFYDKGIALLARALKVTPGEERLQRKLHAFEVAKGLEHKRAAAAEGLRSDQHREGAAGTRILQLERHWHHLAPSPLMQRMSADQIRRLFAAAQMVKLEEGTEIARRGAKDPVLWVLMSGTVEALLERDDGHVTELRTFGSGAVLGERPALERDAWPADYRVTEPGVALRLDRKAVQAALAGNPDPRAFLESLRMDANDRQVAEIVEKLEARKS